MKATTPFQRTYFWLLKLYPLRFRAVFEAEMRLVFASRLAEARGRGGLAMFGMLLRELLDAPGSLISAYRCFPPTTIWERWRDLLFDPVLPLPGQTGRDSWRQAALEVSPFACLGSLLILSTYLPVGLTGHVWKADWAVICLAAALLPMLLVGLLRGMPRWAYPPGGLLLGCSLLTANNTRLLPFWLSTLAVLLLVAILSVRLHARFQPLPGWLYAAGKRLRLDTTRLSFGVYGLLPLAIPWVYDDGFLDGRALWLALSAGAMLLGAVIYARSCSRALQMTALLAGTTLALWPALFDRAAALARLGASPSLSGSVWVLGFWLALALFMLVPLACHNRTGGIPDPQGEM